jgi:7,8-dihydropterin-6-yl-methyl-4-(beta-D-ribofuranosyl)aminobenzene 5'-phosphate synthase
MERTLLEDFSERIHAHSEPSMLAPDICISGAIARKTAFEHGMTGAFVESGGKLVHDDIPDDQALYLDLEGKGIVVLTGCCHSGLINTIMKGRNSFQAEGSTPCSAGFI